MTREELYRLGSESKEALFVIHHELGHTMPRISRINGRIAAEFWYFSVDGTERKPAEYVKMYAAIDPYTQEILCTRTYTSREDFPASWETGYMAWRLRHGFRYLNRCARMLNKERITDGELRRLRRRWMDLQPDWIRRFAAAPETSDFI